MPNRVFYFKTPTIDNPYTVQEVSVYTGKFGSCHYNLDTNNLTVGFGRLEDLGGIFTYKLLLGLFFIHLRNSHFLQLYTVLSLVDIIISYS